MKSQNGMNKSELNLVASRAHSTHQHHILVLDEGNAELQIFEAEKPRIRALFKIEFKPTP